MSKATKHAIDTSDMDCDNSRFIYLKKMSSGEKYEYEGSGSVQPKRKIKTQEWKPGKSATVKTAELQKESKENTTLQIRTKTEKAYQEIFNIFFDFENSIPKRILEQITSRVAKFQILL